MNAILKSDRKIFSDTFSIKKGSKNEDPVSPNVLHFALEYGNRWVQVDREGLK